MANILYSLNIWKSTAACLARSGHGSLAMARVRRLCAKPRQGLLTAAGPVLWLGLDIWRSPRSGGPDARGNRRCAIRDRPRALGAWRYGWGAVHLAAALWYRHVVFPRWRRAPTRSGAAGRVARLHRDRHVPGRRRDHRARLSGRDRRGDPLRPPATIVAGVGELADQRWIKRAFQQMKPPPEIRLAFVRRRHRQAPSDGLALRAVSRMRPSRDAAVVLLDGDALLTPGAWRRACLSSS